MYSTKDLGADTWLGTASYWAGSLIIQALSGTRKNPTGCFCDLYPLKSMRKSFSVGTDIPQKVPIVFKKRAGDLFLFEIKKECTNFLRNVQKGQKIVQNLDVRLLCFLRQKCAYFAIFGTQLHNCDLFYWNLKELQDPWWRIWSLNDSAIFGIHNTSQKKDRKFFCLPLPPIFNLRWLECLEIPTIVTKEGYYFFSLLYPPIFTSDDLNVWNSSNNSAELACFEPISLVFCSWTQKFYWGVSLKVWKRKNTL